MENVVEIPLRCPVADLDADLRVRVAGRSKAGRKPATNRCATRFELSRHVQIARTCLRPAFDSKKSQARLKPARTCRKPGRKPGLRPALRPG